MRARPAPLWRLRYDVAFIHPKGSAELPYGGEGVLIELVQAPADVIAAHWK